MTDNVEQVLRTSHCARKDRNHECAGSITVTPRGIELSCTLCGSTSIEPSYPCHVHEHATRMSEEFGLRWELLSVEVQQRVLHRLDLVLKNERRQRYIG